MDGFLRDLKLVSGGSRRLAPHYHDEYSLAFVHEGRSLARIAGGESAVGGGDLVLIPPGLAHACNPGPGGEWSYSIFFLDPAWVEGVAGWAAAPARGLRASDTESCRRARAWAAGRTVAGLEALLRDALAAFAGAGEAEVPRPVPAGILAAKARIDRGPGSAPALDALAEIAGLSKWGFVRAFEASFGLSPHAYVLAARINRSKARLAASGDIAATAVESGFCDQSHFSRAFARRVGTTPGAYARGRR